MVILPDGARMDMQWKSVKYINHGDSINFQIVPMNKRRDIIIVPNLKNWEQNDNVFPLEEREEIIFLLEKLNWKREVRVVELDISLEINCKDIVNTGSIESTEAYARLAEGNLFDNKSMLDKEQVKLLYLTIEKKFAETLKGEVKISKDLLLEGSVTNDFVIPILEKNVHVKVIYV
ncbi:MAG: hypothetical protein RR486_16510 [Clostridium sp.]|uniref:hypothetical protein n=1 Tax=Clostridium sp. TaxID=1506 RepID=UPI0030740D64